MLAALLLVLAAAIPGAPDSASVAPAGAWRPLYAFLGPWKGARTGPGGTSRVTRTYASASTNHHLEIVETGGGHAGEAPWGSVVFDAQRQGLVLRRVGADGVPMDLVLDAAASAADRLVFETAPGETPRTRVVDQRSDWNHFTERIERVGGAGPDSLLVETRFERKE